MPKLPSDEVLGRIPSAESGRPFVSLNTSAPGAAMEQMGKGIADLGKGIASGIKAFAEEGDSQSEAKARSAFLVDEVKFKEKYKDESDPEVLGKAEEEYRGLVDKHASAMPGRAAEKFRLDYAPRIAQQGVSAREKIAGIEKDKYLADAQGNIDLMRELAIDPEVDDETRQTAIGVVNDYIDEMKSKGYLSEQEGEKRRKDWVDKYAWDRIQMLPPEQRAYAIGGIEGALIGRESGGRPRIMNDWGYVGLYQYGAPRLQSLGVYSPGDGENMGGWSKSAATAPGKWSGTFNIPGFPQVKTVEDFRNNPDAQRAVYQIDSAYMDKEIAQRGLDQYIGKTVGGVLITRDGIKAMIHLGGAGGASAALASGGQNNAADANGTKVLDYARMASRGDGTIANILPPDKREQLRETTYRELAQRKAQDEQGFKLEQSAVKRMMSEDIDSITQTGKPIADLTPKRVEDAYGPDARADFERQRYHASRYYEQTNDFDRLSEGQIGERLNTLDPRKNGQAGQVGFTEADAYFQKALAKAQALIKERRSDPAQAADRQPDVAEARQSADINQPETYRPLIARRQAAQERFGIPAQARRDFTAAEYSALFDPIDQAMTPREQQAQAKVLVEQLQKIFGDDKDRIERNIQAALEHYKVSKDMREVLARVLVKAGLGGKADQADKQAVDDAAKQDAQAKAAAALIQVAPNDYMPGTGAPLPGGLITPDEQGPPAPPRKSMTKDEIAQLWSRPNNAKMVQRYTEVFGEDEVKKQLQNRPADWDGDLWQRYQAGKVQARPTYDWKKMHR